MSRLALIRASQAMGFLLGMRLRRWQTARRGSERGQAIVIVVLAMVVMLGFAALAIDGGNYLNHRRIAQNSADAGALGGTEALATNPAISELDVLKTVHAAAEANGTPDSNGISGDGVNGYVLAFYTLGDGTNMSDGQDGADFNCGGAGGDDDFDDDGVSNPEDDDDDNDGIDDVDDNNDDNDGIDDADDDDDDNDGVDDADDNDDSESGGQCRGIDGGGTVPPSARGIRVLIRYPLTTFLAGFVGRSNLPVEADAIAAYQPPLPCGGYAVFADRTDGNPNTMHFTGSSSTVIGGGLHSNSGIHLGGFTTDVGPVEYDVDDQANLSNYVGPALTQVPHFPIPQLYDIADFQPPNGTYWTQACADGKCFQSAHLTQIQSDGLYYVDGDVDVGNAETSQAVTIVATGPIKISVRPNVSFRPYIAGLFLFSTQTAPGQPAIDLGGHSPEDNPRGYDGILFAPYGVIKMSSQNTHEVRGAVFGWEVDFSGSVNIINFHPEYCPPTRAKIFTLK